LRQADVRAFVEAHLRLRGVRLHAGRGDLLPVTLPGGDGRPDPVDRLLAFGARAYRRSPEAELVAVGSAFLDGLIEEATAGGRFTVVHLPPPARRRRPKAPLRLPRVEGREWGPPEPASRPLFLFAFLAEYHIIDVPDDLVLLAIDPARRVVLESPRGLLAQIKTGSPQPVEAWPPLPAWPSPGELLFAFEALERRLQRRAGRVKEASAIEIARETANIEAYYRQLISEVRAPAGRPALSAEDEAERVRVLQLDWKRRVQEVSRFWEARGDVRLSALGAVMEPCWALPLLRRGKRQARVRAVPRAVAGCRSGALEEPRCALCGATLVERAEVSGRDLVCEGHGSIRDPGGEPERSAARGDAQ